MKDEEEVQKLIALKRYETPGDAYYEQFLENFKERQRSEMLRHSSRALLAERVATWLDGSSGAKWLAPAGAVAAAVAAGMFLVGPDENENAAPTELLAEETAEATPTVGEDDFELDLPKPDIRPPLLKADASGSTIPVGLKGNLREL